MEGMARGFKGLGMGIVDGVTGVVTKPIDGARQGGAGGFMKVSRSGIFFKQRKKNHCPHGSC